MRCLVKSALVLVLLLLSGCAKVEDRICYLAPADEASLFHLLEKDLMSEMHVVNGGREMEDYQLKAIGHPQVELVVEDIHGNLVDLSELDMWMLESVAHWCTHCKLQAKENMESIIASHPEITYVQYFRQGNLQEIESFYEDMDIPENLIIIPENEELMAYMDEIGMCYFPTSVFFKDHQVSWMNHGEITPGMFDLLYSRAFEKPYDQSQLVNEKGENVWEAYRSTDKLFEELDPGKKLNLVELDNDGDTIINSLKLMARKVDYTVLGQSYEKTFDYTGYKTKDLVLFYLFLYGDRGVDSGNIALLNKIMKEYPDYAYHAILIESGPSSMDAYQKLDALNCPVVSSQSALPKALQEIAFRNYPSALFIEKSTLTGAYSNIYDASLFKEALALFFGEGSIARCKD